MTDLYQHFNWIIYELAWIGIAVTVIAVTLIITHRKDNK